MNPFRAAVVGAGPPAEDAPGYAIGYAHGNAYRERDDVSLAAVADVVPENAAAFAREFGIEDGVFEDHRAMLRAVEPDVVSVCTPPRSHPDVVVDCAREDVPAIHCEKPMAITWRDFDAWHWRVAGGTSSSRSTTSDGSRPGGGSREIGSTPAISVT